MKPLISNKREFLARWLCDAGILRLLERRARAGRPGLLVLTYHRIGDPAGNSFYAPVVSATPEAFRAQVGRLRDTFRVLTLDEAVALIDGGFRTREPSALVTFDDGTRDHVEVALPILKELGVPATFFLSTGLIDAPRLPWYDLIAYVINHTTVPVLRLDRPEPLEIELSRLGRAGAVARVVRACLDHDIDVNGEQAFRDHLADRADVALDADALGRSLFLSWDDARALLDAGMSVGSHAHSHRMLARLPELDQRDELARSRAILEERLGRAPAALAYPYGWPGAFDASTERLAREAGYALAFASVEGVNRPGTTDPFAVRRLGVGFTDSPVLLRARLALYAGTGKSVL
jgi:peptidoglycan/xylan/chitin deacetylase (PgdA/CDA1 family)